MEKRSNNNKKRPYKEMTGYDSDKVENSLKSKKVKEEVKDDNQQQKKMHRVIVWFRNDLRMLDNPCLSFAAKLKGNKEVIPVFSFDPRIFGHHVKKYDTLKTGIVRAQFIQQSVLNLRERLEAIGSKLIVTKDKPEDFLKTLVDAKYENILVYQQESCSEEMKVERLVQESLSGKTKVDIQSIWGATLYHIDDLPFKPADLAHIYGKFRERSQGVKVRDLLEAPKIGELPFPKNFNKDIQQLASYSPTLKDLGYQEEKVQGDKRSCYKFIGGEDAALNRCEEYIFGTKSVARYADTRNFLIGANSSSKLSPWLANGCISIRHIYHEVKKFQKVHGSSELTKVFIDQLFWRDFLRFWAIKYGDKIFSSYGIYDRTYYAWKEQDENLAKWREGKTGMPLIDALMREMNTTGFMPNRGRMVAACYLAQDLRVDWRYGAAYFEEKLIDHDVYSNYGGWAFSAGIGPGRVLVFNSVKQSRDFDRNGDYVKMWVPELQNVPIDYIHDPWKMPAELQAKCRVKIGETYPKPIDCDKYTDEKKAKEAKIARSAVVPKKSQKAKAK